MRAIGMKPDLTLALDVGTSAAKLALFDGRGRRLLLLRKSLALRRLAGGGFEQDPESYVRAVKALLREAGARIPAGARVARAGIACQRSTVVVWERATGRPLGPAVTWMDRRAAARIARLSADSRDVARRTGLRLSAHYSAAHLARRFAAEPRLACAARRGVLVIGPVASFVLARLGAFPAGAACDPTLAQRTSLYDPWRGQWDPRLCDLFGIPRACLPELRPSGGDWGALRIGGCEVPVRALAGDQQCAAAAFDLDGGRGAALVHYGTGAFCLWPEKRRARAGTGSGGSTRSRDPESSRDGLLRSARADRPGMFYREGTVQSAGAALDVVAGWVGRARLQRILARTARTAPPAADSALLVPAFAGLGAPHWDDRARAVLVAVRPPAPGEVVEAALAGIAHRVADSLDQDPRGGSGDLILSGPLASIDELVRLQSDVTGRPVRIAREPEATLLGVARIAARADGETPPPAARPGPRVRSRAAPARRRELREMWRSALAASRGADAKGSG